MGYRFISEFCSLESLRHICCGSPAYVSLGETHGTFAGRGARNGSRREVSSMTDKGPIIAVLGIDVGGRAHASRFEERDAPFVLRTAEMMGFHVVRVPPDNDELLA